MNKLSHSALRGRPVQVIAHRGARTHANPKRIAPENTMPAFKEAARQNSAVELDVIATKDGRVMVHHDFETGRMYNLKGGKEKQVHQTTSQELAEATLNVAGHEKTVKKMLGPDSKYTTPDKFRDLPMPELKTVFEELPDTHVFVELKVDTDKKQTHGKNKLEERVAKLIKDKNLYDRATVISFSPESLRKIKALDPKIHTGLNVELPEKKAKDPHYLRNFVNHFAKQWAGVESIQPNYEAMTPELVQIAHDANLQIKPWVNHQTRAEEKALFPELLNMGVDGIITNAVDALKKTLRTPKTISANAGVACGLESPSKRPLLCYTDDAWSPSKKLRESSTILA